MRCSVPDRTSEGEYKITSQLNRLTDIECTVSCIITPVYCNISHLHDTAKAKRSF